MAPIPHSHAVFGATGSRPWRFFLHVCVGFLTCVGPAFSTSDSPSCSLPGGAAARYESVKLVACVPAEQGRWWAVATQQPPMLRILDASGNEVRRWPVASLERLEASHIQGVWALKERRSWLLVPGGLKEWWEISHDPEAEPLFDGWVHDYRMGEGLATAGFLGVRRIPLAQPMALVGVESPPGLRLWLVPQNPVRLGSVQVDVLHLSNRRVVASALLEEPVQQGAGRTVQEDGRWYQVLDAASGAGTWWVPLPPDSGPPVWKSSSVRDVAASISGE